MGIVATRFPPTVWFRRSHCFDVGQDASPGIDRQRGGVIAITALIRRKIAVDINGIFVRNSGDSGYLSNVID